MNQRNNYWPSLFYPVATALSIVFRHTLNVSINPMFSLLVSAIIATVVFHLINIKNTKFMYQRIRENIALFIKVNFLIGVIWVAAFAALKFINPISYCVVYFATPAICAFINIYWHNKRLSFLLTGIGLLIVLFVFVVGVLLKQPTISNALGLVITFIGGFTGYIYKKVSYKYSQHMGGAPTIVLATRGFGIIGISLIVLLGFTFSGMPVMSTHWSEQLMAIFIVVVVLTFLLPVYLNQKGIEAVGPKKHSLLVALCPLFTFIIAAAFLQHKMHDINMFSGVIVVLIAALLSAPYVVTLIKRRWRKIIMIVDPFISPDYLSHRFKAEGYKVFALKTLDFTTEHQDYIKYFPGKIIASVGKINEDLRSLCVLAKQKTTKAIAAVIPGLTATVPYAEQISSALHSAQSNDPATSKLRFDKFVMNDTLKSNGLPAIKQCLIAGHLSIDEKIVIATKFLSMLSGNEAVIKPNSGSSGTTGVEVVKNSQELMQYFKANLTTKYGHNDYLLQEKILGIEYYIDVAAYDGKHIVSGVGSYDKKTDEGLFEGNWNENISPFEPSIQPIIDYVNNVILALDIRNGLYHIEVMDTADGPRLIEVNSRVSGSHGYINIMAKACHGVDQIDAYCSLLEDRGLKFKPFQSYNRLYKFKNKKGNFEIFDITRIESLASLASFEVLKTVERNFNPNQYTTLDHIALVHLSAKTQADIDRDTKILQELEKSGACFSG